MRFADDMLCQSFKITYVFDTTFFCIWDEIYLPFFVRHVHDKYWHSYPTTAVSKRPPVET